MIYLNYNNLDDETQQRLLSMSKKEEEKSKLQLWLNAGYRKLLGPLNVEAQKVSAQVVSLVDLLVDQAHADIT